LEGTYDVYKAVELDAAYLHAQSFVHGTKISISKLKELEAIDNVTYDNAWKTLRAYLLQKGWEGSVPPTYSVELTAANLKEAYEIVTGIEFKTMVRTPSKLLAMIPHEHRSLKDLLQLALDGEFLPLNHYVESCFSGEPEFNTGSPKQLQKLFYEVMDLPIKVFNKPTDVMRSKGIKQGTPKTDSLAVAYALQDVGKEDERYAVLQALQLMKMVETRRGLYYATYPFLAHWKTGRIHSSHNQCATNTRRASSSGPNLQQLPKHAKIEGQASRFREVFIPHKRDAVIVSMDFMAQELRVIADYTKDTNMLSCFIGDDKKDMHALTGLGIFNSRTNAGISYAKFVEILNNPEDPLFKEVKKTRQLGKLTNFTTEFGAAAPKLAQTLMVSEEEAQVFIDAKEAAFLEVRDWKNTVIAETKAKGYTTTKLGARRHLRSALLSSDRFVSSKAERQAVNFKIQSSSAEMTKLAEGRMWKAQLEQRFDCEIISPIHDEVVASISIADLPEALKVMHACMVGQYADMIIPVGSSISFGPSFGQQIEIGEVADDEAIAKGLQQLKGN
jgi:DNA polymerase I-like protein with 3'-5' exonuclease and polymerase domains